MRRILCSILLIVSILASFVQPIFAAEDETASVTVAQTEQETFAESTEAEQESSQEPTEDESVSEQEATQPLDEIKSELRGVQTFTTSAEGIAFVNEMMGGSYGGTSQLAAAEKTVNGFITSNHVSLRQQQFDALVDLVMAYGGYILTSGYKIQTIIASGKYTDCQLADAFCSWVKEGSSFSQSRLNRRLREVKLFLYDSYDGNTDRVSFRYVIFYPNGGTLNENTVLCYPWKETYKNLPTASRSGKYFAGWYTAASGGTHLTNADVVSGNQTVYAQWSSSAVDKPNEPKQGGSNSGLNMRTSESCIQFIKQYEGFKRYAYWDYGQYSIGYGTRCDPSDYPNGITEEEADYLLRQMLLTFEPVVERIEKKRGKAFTQNEFDAVLSFTFNLGQQWIGNSRIYQCLIECNYTETDFVNAIGSWASAGGTILTNLMRRRMDEANMFLHGDYTKGSTKYFGAIFKGLEGEAEKRVYYYVTGAKLGYLPSATREGYHLTGWYDKSSGGTQYTVDTIAPPYGTQTLYARWEEGAAPQPPPPPPVDNGFVDVPLSAWYYEYVMMAVEAGLFSGISKTEFAPDQSMTRAMLVTVLYRLAGVPATTAEIPFADVAAGQWYEAAVRWAYETKIVNGVSESEFGVNQNVTREQLTTMLYRYAQHYSVDTSARADLTSFNDVGALSSYAVEPMQWAVGEGIVNGDGGNLMPTGNATRAQCAKMLIVFAQVIRTA